MTTTELIKKHQTCIEILEAVRVYEKKIATRKELVDGFQGAFPIIRKEYLHNIEIYQMCIVRLMKRYENLLKTL